MSELFDLSGKVALITGGSSGIGKAIAKAMGDHGATVVVASNDSEGCRAVCEELTSQGIRTVGIPCDVSSSEQVVSLVEQTISEVKRIDILVCNAGISGHEGPIATVTNEDWNQLMTVNLKSAMQLANLVVPYMERQRDGSIIFMSSIASIRGNKNIGLYGLSKAAIAQLARNLAVEWGPKNIRANSISPGLIETPFSTGILSNEEYLPRRLSLTPLRRVGKPEEIAGVAVMLASKAGAFITGQNIVVDGGTVISDGN